jgi:hypothetical protein
MRSNVRRPAAGNLDTVDSRGSRSPVATAATTSERSQNRPEGEAVEHERVPVELDPKHALELLGGAEFGRVAFLADGVPTIRPLNHVVLDGRIIVYTRHTSALAQAVRRQADLPVTYQADEIEHRSRLGWSVLVTGTAADISRDFHARQLGLQVQSWMKLPLDMVIAIEPQEVTGLRLTAGN